MDIIACAQICRLNWCYHSVLPCYHEHHLTDHICSLGVLDIFDLFSELQRIEVVLFTSQIRGQILKCVLQCYHQIKYE